MSNSSFGNWKIFLSNDRDNLPASARWHEVAVDAGVIHTVFVDEPERQIFALFEGSPSSHTLDHCLNDLTFPRLAAFDGHLVLHGSLVSTAAGLIGFIGPSGQGKSTLAASFAVGDAVLLTDDAFRLEASAEKLWAARFTPSLRLFPDVIAQILPDIGETTPVAEYTSKRRVPLAAEQDGGLITALFRLADDVEHIRITRLAPAEACMAMISNAFALEAGEPREASRRFVNAVQASSAAPVFDLHYPRDFNRLPEVHAAILDEVRFLSHNTGLR